MNSGISICRCMWPWGNPAKRAGEDGWIERDGMKPWDKILIQREHRQLSPSDSRDIMPLDHYDFLCIRVQMHFQCQRCCDCCKVADPIEFYPKIFEGLRSRFNISEKEALDIYTVPHPLGPELWAFKERAQIQFYDKSQNGSKICKASPMVCRCR